MLKIKKIDNVFVENQMENHYESYDENPPYHSEAGKPKYLQH